MASSNIQFEEIVGYCEEYRKRNPGENFLVITATGNGYHNLRVRPLVGFDMMLECEREPDNHYDENAILIRVPVMRRLRDVLDVVIREERNTRDIAGKHVGRAPKCLASIMSPLLDTWVVSGVECVYTVTMRHGSCPLGDGPKQNCLYFTQGNSIEG